jgi:urease beta subunit
MTTYSNTSYAVKNVSTSGSTAISAISSGTVAVSSLILSNTSSSPITVNAYIARSSVNYYLVYQATVPVGGSLEVIQGNRVVMLTGDSMTVTASASTSCDAWVSALTAV